MTALEGEKFPKNEVRIGCNCSCDNALSVPPAFAGISVIVAVKVVIFSGLINQEPVGLPTVSTVSVTVSKFKLKLQQFSEMCFIFPRNQCLNVEINHSSFYHILLF